jgi:hypothetical protein
MTPRTPNKVTLDDVVQEIVSEVFDNIDKYISVEDLALLVVA